MRAFRWGVFFCVTAAALACERDMECTDMRLGQFGRCAESRCHRLRCDDARPPGVRGPSDILYVGDSVSLGMLSAAPIPGVHHAENRDGSPRGNSRNGIFVNGCIKKWLATHKPRCVLLNFGLHDVKTDACGVDKRLYAALVRRAISIARSHTACTAWVSTTPAPDCDP